MDRIIGATVAVKHLTLITADEPMRNSGRLKTVW